MKINAAIGPNGNGKIKTFPLHLFSWLKLLRIDLYAKDAGKAPEWAIICVRAVGK